jgi:regulatory protein
MTSARARKRGSPLDEKRLDELALAYVGRFATTRAKLRSYLARKIRERGWGGACDPDLETLANRLAGHGYVDDAAYALAKSQALTGRGYGKRRVVEKLRSAGVEDQHSEAARAHADEEALAAALHFAERRRLGPFAPAPVRDPQVREKALAAMVRAGHSFAVARAVISLVPGEEVDLGELAERARLSLA